MFGAIYYITPLILNVEPFATKKVRVQAIALIIGVVIYGVALSAGGIFQGINLNNPNLAFADVVKGTFPFLFTSTIGSLFIVVAGLMFLFNLLSFAGRACRACCENKKSEARS